MRTLLKVHKYISDEFIGNSIDSKWSTSGLQTGDSVSIADGKLCIDKQSATDLQTILVFNTIDGASYTPGDDYTLESKLDLTGMYEDANIAYAGITLFYNKTGASDSYYRGGRVTVGIDATSITFSSRIYFAHNNYINTYKTVTTTERTVYLRCVKSGSNFSHYYKIGDSGSWTLLKTQALTDYGSIYYVEARLYARDTAQGNVKFDYMRISPDFTESTPTEIDLTDIGNIATANQQIQAVNEYNISKADGERAIKNKYRNIFTYNYSFIDDNATLLKLWDYYLRHYEIYLYASSLLQEPVMLRQVPYQYVSNKAVNPFTTLIFESLFTTNNPTADFMQDFDTYLYERKVILSGGDSITYKINNDAGTGNMGVYVEHDGNNLYAYYNGKLYKLNNEQTTYIPAVAGSQYFYIQNKDASTASDTTFEHLLIWGI